MFQTKSGDRESRAGSLLSLAGGEPQEHADDASLPPRPDADPSAGLDAAARHRLARSRREKQGDSLLAALAADRDSELMEVPPDQEEFDGSPAISRDAAPAGTQTARGLRALIRERLIGTPARDDAAIDGARERPAQAVNAGPFEADAPTRLQTPADEQRSDAGHDDDGWRPLIDPMKVVMGVVNSKMLIVAFTLLGAFVGVVIALSTPKKYEAAAEILIDPRALKLVDRDLTGSDLPSDATLAVVENQVRVLTSGSVLNKVVDRLNLENDPEFNGQRGGGGIGNIVSDLRALVSRGDVVTGGSRSRALTVSHLAENLRVERGGKTFVVTVAVTTEDPEKSALIANTMTDVFLQTYGEFQSDTATRATDELTARLDELRAGVEAAERKVEAYKAANDIIDPQGRLITDDEIVKLNEQLSIARARTSELRAKVASTQGLDVDTAVGGTLPEELNSSGMTELRSQYAVLKQQADSLAVRLGPRHPQRLAMDAQLAGARSQIAAELRRIVSSAGVELKRAVRLEQELSSRLARLKVRRGDVNTDLVSLRELEREATAKRSVYEAYLLRAKQTGEQKDINAANMSVISKAYAPLDPEGPSRAAISFMGMVLGFLAGTGMGAARGAWQGLRENIADQPRAASAPRSGSDAPRDPGPASPAPPEPATRGRRPGDLTRAGDHAGGAGRHAQSHASGGFSASNRRPRAPRDTLHDAPMFRRVEQGQNPIEEIRDDLRAFREAVDDLARTRSRRRHF